MYFRVFENIYAKIIFKMYITIKIRMVNQHLNEIMIKKQGQLNKNTKKHNLFK